MTKEELEEMEAYIASKPRIEVSLEDVSPSFLCPEGAKVIMIPLCNVCKKWDDYGKCKHFRTSPEIYRSGKSRDCPAAILDPDGIGFSRFSELYPEDTARLLNRVPEIHS